MERRKRIEYPIALFLLLLIFALPVAVADYYAWSTVYFNVPVTIGFTVSLPGAASNITATDTSPGGQTDDIYFNATTGNDKHVNAGRNRAAAANTSIQDEPNAIPILQFKNTGTVNISIAIRWNNTPSDGYAVYANLSSPTGSVGTLMTDNTLLTNTIQSLVTGLPQNNVTNVYLYANFSAAQGGLSSAYQLLYNATQT